MPDRTSSDLLALLARERTAIRTAQFAELDGIAEQKDNLFGALPSTAAPEVLTQIKTQLLGNQALLGAAISGIAAAKERITALRNVREGLCIYDQSGQIAKVPTRRPEVEKKA